MMRTAVVYYSMGGNTRFAAEQTAKQLGAALIPISPVKAYPDKGFRKFLWGGKSAVMGDMPELEPYSFGGGDYDRIIICTPVWASSFTPPIRTFIEENRSALEGKEIAAVICYSGGGADKAIAKLKSFLGTDSFAAELILTDPKDKPSPANDRLIAEFCEKLRG